MNVKWIGKVLLVLGCSAAASAQSTLATLATLVLTDVTVIDVGAGRAQPNLTVVIEGDRITGLGAKDALSIPAGATVVNAGGKYVIPGLWDMHVHTVFGDWFPQGKEIALPLFIANGVTGVRDMGGELEILLQWRKDIAQGSLVGPRMVLSGPMLDGPAPRFPSSIPVATPDDGRRAVADLKRRGADFIKLQSLMSAESVDAILDEARKNGIPVAGHVPDAVRAIDASNAGQKSFEHLIGIFEASSSREDEFFKGGAKSAGTFLESFDAKKSAALIATLAKNQTWQCPTMVWERGGGLLDDGISPTTRLPNTLPRAGKRGPGRHSRTRSSKGTWTISPREGGSSTRRKRSSRRCTAREFRSSRAPTRLRGSTFFQASASTRSSSSS